MSKRTRSDEEESNDEVESNEIVRQKHAKYAKIFGTESSVLHMYSRSFLKTVTRDLCETVPDIPSFIRADDFSFQLICNNLIKDGETTAKICLIRNTLKLAQANGSQESSTREDVSGEQSSDQSIESHGTKSSSQKFWKISKLPSFFLWQEKSKSVFIYGTTPNEMVVLHDKFRPVSKRTFDICSKKIELYIALVLGASIQGAYITEFYNVSSPKRTDEVSISLVRYLSSPSSKKTYNENETSAKPTISTRKGPAYQWPSEVEEICMKETGFTGTVEEFRACIGWYQTKNSMIKKEVANVINKPKIENPPCPFGYGSYGIDVGITEDSNKKQRPVAIRRQNSNILSINDL